MDRHASVGLGLLVVAMGAVACGASSDSSASGGQDVVAAPAGSAKPAPAAPATSANPATPGATTPAAPAAPTVLFSCTDKTDPTNTGRLTVDAAFNFVWQISDDTVTTTLVGVTGDDENGYSFHTASGHFVELDVKDFVLSMSGLDAECDAATAHLDHATLDGLVKATAASVAKQQSFASCQRGDGNDSQAPATFTVRPALGGAGAVIEGNAEEDESVVLFATSLTADASAAVSYAGAGGIAVFAAGQHVTSFASMTSAGAAGSSTLTWNLTDSDAKPAPIVSSSCTIQGADFAKSLIQSK